MKQPLFRCLSLVLALCLSLSSPAAAAGINNDGRIITGSAENDSIFPSPPHGAEQETTFTAYSDMEYTRPDPARLQALLDQVCTRARGRDVDSILDGVFAFYDAYDQFCTASALAYIHYSGDLTSSYWEEENNFCTNAGPTAQQMLDSLYNALAASPCRRALEQAYFGMGYFDSYTEEAFWDDQLVALMEQENQLISRYYTQSRRLTTILGSFFPKAEEMAETLAELILIRNEMAAYAGYDSYESFANDLYYYRDYTPEEMTAYLDGVRDHLAPMYPAACKDMEDGKTAAPNQALDFVRTAAQAMGGTAAQAFRLMEEAGLYDIDAGKHKFDTSYELYLPSYQEPFLFMNPAGMESDCLILAHEFGHFCNDYASLGTAAGVDVCEIFSQGFEYLSLCCHPEAQRLTRYKMADSLSIYVEQACYARFEQRMYQLSNPTAKALRELYQATAAEYGMVDACFSPWDFVYIPHFYTNPMYVSSYIFSNDAAMQLYQLECQQSGAGIALYQQSLSTQQPYFLAFLEEAGLESPFAPGRLEEVAAAFRVVFPDA